VLVFDRTLTAAERRTAEEYLARRWAQPVAPSAVAAPTVTRPATNCTISGLTPGNTDSLTVTATNAVGTGPASSAANGTA
jgi:hypothetical protein